MDIVEKVTSNRDRPAPPGQDSGVTSTTSRANEKKTMPLVPKFNAVPRRATTGKENHELPCNLKDEFDEEIAAPLGFEPEGSATRPSFCEGCSSLQELLSDRYGYEVFYEYLQLQNYESLLAFWRSCEKFRQLAKVRSGLALPTANATYAKYMHKKLLCGSRIDDSIRAKIKHKLNSGQPLNESMFDSAQEAIFSYINDYFYASFIRSDVYKDFVGDGAVKIPTKDRVSTTARSARFTAKALPTLPEEKVFEGDASHGQWTNCDPAIRSIGRQADGMNEGYVLQNLSKAAMAGMFCQPIPPVVSVNDSDVQSLSSDALTDDSKSTVTDFSDMTSKSAEKKKREQGFHGVPGFIPRNKRLPKDRKQLPPEEFARILIERLERVQVEREQEERAATNLASLPREHFRESKKSILQDAADRHRQFQQAGQFGLGIPAQKLTESCYPIHGNPSIISSSAHVGFVEQCSMSSGYYQNTESIDSANGTWRGCVPNKNMLDSPQCAALTNTKKQWESVGTIESAPDSGVCIEEEHSLQPDLKDWIVQWMEQGEKEATELPQQSSGYTKHTRTKHASGRPVLPDQGLVNIQPIAQDPLMPPLPQPDSRNTLEEASRRLTQKNCREKRSKSHHKNRPGYISSKSSQVTCPQFSGSSVSGDYHQKCMYSSSSVLSSAPTVNSNDSGLGPIQKRNKKQPETTTVVYYLGSEGEPYQSTLPGKVILLGQFKHLITFKKGNHRYFFKRKSDEEACGAIFEEITDDNAPLPLFNGKITCKVKFV